RGYHLERLPDFPHLHALVLTAGGNPIAAGAERDGRDSPGVVLERGQFGEVLDSPDADHLVLAAGDDLLAVRAEGARAPRAGGAGDLPEVLALARREQLPPALAAGTRDRLAPRPDGDECRGDVAQLGLPDRPRGAEPPVPQHPARDRHDGV